MSLFSTKESDIQLRLSSLRKHPFLLALRELAIIMIMRKRLHPSTPEKKILSFSRVDLHKTVKPRKPLNEI